MRYATGTYPWHKIKRIELDGVKQSDVVACDDEEGWLERYQHDSNGRLVTVDRDTPNARLAIERLTGKVEVIMKEEK